ncbi:MAG: hypothetical protein GC129_02460 [Proteobacteria bacterium]|nr:hypothetical protein [Pseudomonadota bacterium]
MTLFLPFGLLLLGIVTAAVMVWRGRERGIYGSLRRGASSMVLLLLFVFGWLAATPAVGSGIEAMLFNQVEGRVLGEGQNVDAIVVLTAGILNAGPGQGWMPKPESIHRLAVAYELQRKVGLRVPVIVSGGFTHGVRAPSEARAVAQFFADIRSEVTPTELEEVSTDSYESALQLAPVLAKRGAKNVLLVTSDVHMLRALATFRARGVDAIPMPVMNIPYDSGVRYYLPSVYGLGITTDALYEVYALAFYLLTGKINFSDLSYNQAGV